jgi:hypothetical protein
MPAFFMAYDREKIIEQALQVIEQEDCTKISEVLLYLPISKRTFYEWELHESHEILTKIEAKKVALKKKMRKSWAGSGIPALEIAAFKLLAAEDEADALNTTKVSNSHSFNEQPKIVIDFGEFRKKDQGD